MDKLLLIYNPFSGNQSFKDNLDTVIDILQDKGKFSVIVYRMSRTISIDEFLSGFDKDELDTVCISGGDGTINIVINSLQKQNMLPKIGLFPSGTANDFCSSLGFTKDPIECANIIASRNIKEIDFGKVNDKYFINVICVGVFAEVSQGVDADLKHSIGKLAYYVQGAKVLSSVSPLTVRITTETETFTEKTYLILILNSDRAGGFKLAPLSEMNDGVFDFVLFRTKNVQSASASLIKVLNGNHIKDENVLYLQGNKFLIESINGSSEIDIDGEKGPALPLDVKVMKNKLKIYSN